MGTYFCIHGFYGSKETDKEHEEIKRFKCALDFGSQT